MIRLTLRWMHLLWLVVALGAVGGLFWMTAPYTISARAHHIPGVGWALHRYLKHYVRSRTLLDRVPEYVDIDSPALRRLGAGHYATACAVCHGAPGAERNPVARMMNPEPTDLAEVRYSAPAFQHIGYHGFRYSGMPAWPGLNREDETWAIAAFLSDYKDMTPETYRDLAYGDLPVPAPRPGTAQDFAMLAGEIDLAASCARCHGRDGMGREGTAPALAGQDEVYLKAALDAYADDRRQSGYMEPIAAALTPQQRADLAARFAAMPGLDGAPVGAATIDLPGESIAERGIEHRDVPACSGCHGEKRKPGWPIITGQSEQWLATWLRLWREHPNGALGQDEKMHAAARHLTDADIAALADYYAGR